MASSAPIILTGAVEGELDKAVLRRLVTEAGAELGEVYGLRGKGHLLQQLHRYNQAARLRPWVVLVDLDRDADCAPVCRKDWLPTPASHMCFRIVVRAVEAWLLADADEIARFLGVQARRVPARPEDEDDPKLVLLQLAGRSRNRELRQDLVAAPGSGRNVGARYSHHLIEFARHAWRPEIAATRAESLQRCRRRLRELVESL